MTFETSESARNCFGRTIMTDRERQSLCGSACKFRMLKLCLSLSVESCGEFIRLSFVKTQLLDPPRGGGGGGGSAPNLTPVSMRDSKPNSDVKTQYLPNFYPLHIYQFTPLGNYSVSIIRRVSVYFCYYFLARLGSFCYLTNFKSFINVILATDRKAHV